MVGQSAARRQLYRLGIIIVVLTAVGLGAVAVADPAGAATADVSTETLSVSGANQTVVEGENVSDVTLSATLAYDHDVPDATQRVVELRVGPQGGDTQYVDYVVESEPSGTASGEVDLSGSVIEATDLTADDFDPATATTTTQDLVVEAVIEVERENGETVRHVASDTATVTIEDGTDLTVTVGGDGDLTVETTG